MLGEADRAGEWLCRQRAYFPNNRTGAERGYALPISFNLRVACQKDNDFGDTSALNGKYVARLAIAPLCEPHQAVEGGGSQIGKNEIMKHPGLALQRDWAQFPKNKQDLENIE